MRRLMVADMFKEVSRPVVKIWKEAKRSDEGGNIYTETRRKNDVETVHVLKGKGECLNADALRHTREETERRCGYNAANTRLRHNRLSVGLHP